MKNSGLVFNIQKFCIHDGPGIRTTVFLKGCPLKCRWCANPESQLEKSQLMLDRRHCIRCLRCIQACPKGGIHADPETGYPIFDAEKMCGLRKLCKRLQGRRRKSSLSGGKTYVCRGSGSGNHEGRCLL